MKKSIVILLSLTLLAGCATRGTNYVPIVDLKGDPKARAAFTMNVKECKAYAKRTAGASNGAIFGALAGALIATALGGSSRNKKTGAVLGAAHGAKNNTDTQENIIRKCLRGRGYRVLN